MRRVLVYDHADSPVCELSPDEVLGLTRVEEVNAEHSLTIRTTRELGKGWRVLMRDGRGRWREWVVSGMDETHEASLAREYWCDWSLKSDLMGTRVSRMPGVREPVAAAVALEAALSGTARWAVGAVTVTTTGGASMYDTDGWSAMATLVSTWGGEVVADIEVDGAGVVSRRACLHDAQGEHVARRRLDFGADLRSVRRKVADGPLYCRITPRGKGEETEGGGYGRKVTIEDVNDGVDWLQNDAMVEAARLPDGSGGWEYPTLEVENPDCETPEALLAWARSVLEERTSPEVTYELDAIQAAAEGVDAKGLSLGDAVHVVDRALGGLRVSARVLRLEVDELEERDVQVTLGHVGGGIGSVLTRLSSGLSAVTEAVTEMAGGSLSTEGYISNLLARINADANATGGYTYVTEGQGVRTYDREVSDPLVGAEATQVTELRGGTIRFADSRTAQGEWEWRTVITSGHILASMVTAAELVAGRIGSAAGGSFWDLDSGELRVAAGAALGDSTVGDVLRSVSDNAETASAALAAAASERAEREAFVTDVGAGGVLVHGRSGTSDGVRVSDVVQVIRGSEAVATFGEELVMGALAGAHVTVTGDRISFVAQDGNEVAYISTVGGESVFYMTKAIVVNELNFGDWAWHERDNGNLVLRWMGD